MAMKTARIGFLGVLEARQAQKIAEMRGAGINSGQVVIAGLIGRPLNVPTSQPLQIRRLPDGGLTGLVSPEKEAEIKAAFARTAEARAQGLLKETNPRVLAVLQELRDIEKARSAAELSENPFVPQMKGIQGEDYSEGARKFGEKLDGLFRRPVDPNKAS